MLSEVMREREQQIKCKNVRKDLLDLQEKEYLRLQEEAREKAILAELESSKERAKANKETHQYQLTQYVTVVVIHPLVCVCVCVCVHIITSMV